MPFRGYIPCLVSYHVFCEVLCQEVCPFAEVFLSTGILPENEA